MQKKLSGVLAAVSLVRGRAFHPVAVGFRITCGFALGVANRATGRLGLATRRTRGALATGRARTRTCATTMPHGGNRCKAIAGLHMSQRPVMEMLGNKLIPR